MRDSGIMFFGEVLAKGGWTMVPLYLCSIVALVVFVRKLIEYRAAHLSELGWQTDVINCVHAGNFDAVKTVCNNASHPAVSVVCAVVQSLKERPDQAEPEARRVASLELQKLEKNLSLLSFLGQVAPLLGLLGTVLGMIELFVTFQQSGNANINISELSAGIWKALITTAAGLTIAVPTLAAHSYLASRVDDVRLQMSDIIQRILYAVPQVSSPAGIEGADGN